MKIKRYTAPSMRAALALVRAEQGADAVILSSRRSEEGIEVIAAVDYDEALFVEARLPRTAAVMASPVMTAPPAPIEPVAAKPTPAPRMAAAAKAPPPAAPSAAPKRADRRRPRQARVSARRL